MPDINHLAYLWESGDWALAQGIHSEAHVIVSFAETGVSVKELVALRGLLPQVSTMAPAAVRALAQEERELDLGRYGNLEAQRLHDKAKKLGLNAHLKDASYVVYQPIHRINGVSHQPSDDDAVNQAVITEMLRRNLPIHSRYEMD
ncbi:hypothetical protein QWZ03_02670 [Chitinimonas viridis]|uniref:Uncharacterized protein n=1 Tax=Chitinimonas viridis TaxID=664880 RepID=A0ABT8B0P2_9NEIS|nr:hypothetical protein [Chitinimonas viridis]MDN3575673.1 hypothetical protein [Chitinimonas viridis]